MRFCKRCRKIRLKALCMTWVVHTVSCQLPQAQPDNSSEIFNYSATAASSQLRDDASRVIGEFSEVLRGLPTSNALNGSALETAQLFDQIVHGALSYHLDQGLGNSTNFSHDKLTSMATSINDTLNSINDAADELLSSTNGALKFADLRNCILNLVQQGGLHDGESCVIQGVSITGVAEMMTSVLQNFGDGVIPSNILYLATQALDPVFRSLLPGENNLLSAVETAIKSVQRAITGELVQALDDAARCFKASAFAQISYAERLERTRQCNRDVKQSVFRDLETLYLTITNQFVGFVTPNVLEGVHKISNGYLKKGVDASPEDHYFRNAISDSVNSIVAGNAGNEVTYAYKIAECLDTVVGVKDPETAANKAATEHCLEKPDGPPAALRQIVYGYIQQIYGVLPVEIAAEVERSGIMQLKPSAPDFDQQVKHLHQEFLKTDPGPAYVSCYERFVNCLFDSKAGGVLVSLNNTQTTCILGKACEKTPDGKENPVIHFN